MRFWKHVGASLVFLIDWNKARKVLREWVANADAAHIIEWAARHRVGHRAFLQLGGAELVGSAVRHAAPSRIGLASGSTACSGATPRSIFSRRCSRIAAEALLQGSSVRLARDRIEAALVAHLQRVDRTLLAANVLRKAGQAHEIAADLAHLIAERRAQRPSTARRLPNAHGVSRRKPTASLSRREAKLPGSMPDAASNVW